MRYFAASVNKNQGTIRIPFVEPFSAPPVVILSPQWNSGNAVGAVPTITQITADAVVVSDGNQASDYYVNVLAVEQGAESLDGQPAFPGIVSKNSASVAVTISGPAPSAVLLTPYWPEGPVGSVETLDLQTSMLDPKTTFDTASQLTIISGNSAADYQVNYIALSLGAGGSPVQCGITNKTGNGKQRVYFPTPFDTPPVVLLSPWWDGANSGVGAIDTVTDVTNKHFDFVSGNYAANFSVSWMSLPSCIAPAPVISR